MSIDLNSYTEKRDSGANSVFYLVAISILIFRICSYFMISEDVVITQIVKVILRFTTTIWVLMLLGNTNRNQKFSIATDNNLSPILYLTYLLMGVASLFWTSSFNDSVLHILMDAETLLFSYIYIRLIVLMNQELEHDPIRLSKIIAVAVFTICSVFVIGMIVNPERFYRFTHGGEEARLGGFIINPNELGMLIVIGISTAIIELKHAFNTWSKWVMMVVLIYALVLTGSRSSMIGLLLIILFFATQSKTARMRVLIGTVLFFTTPFIILQLFIKQGDMEEVLNMTGRIPFWKDLLTINFPKEPLLGYGYMRIDYSDKFESINSYAGAMTHNTFLQVLIGLGLVGLFIVLGQLAATIYAIVSNVDSNKRRLCIALFIPVLINSFTEFGIFGETNYGIMMYLFIVFTMSLKPAGQHLRIKQADANGSDTIFRPSVIT